MNKEIKNNIVIHISGPSGVGKTTLGNKLKEKFGNKIMVKDLDDLRFEFVKEKYGSYKKVWSTKDFVWDKKGYQKWIDDYVTEFIIENDPKPGSKLMATYDKDGDRTIVTITSEAKSKPVRKKKKED